EIGEKFIRWDEAIVRALPNDLAGFIDQEVIPLRVVRICRIVLLRDVQASVADERVLCAHRFLELVLSAGQVCRYSQHLDVHRGEFFVVLAGFREFSRAAGRECTGEEHEEHFLFSLKVFERRWRCSPRRAWNRKVWSEIADLGRVVGPRRSELSKCRNGKRNGKQQRHQFLHCWSLLIGNAKYSTPQPWARSRTARSFIHP